MSRFCTSKPARTATALPTKLCVAPESTNAKNYSCPTFILNSNNLKLLFLFYQATDSVPNCFVWGNFVLIAPVSCFLNCAQGNRACSDLAFCTSNKRVVHFHLNQRFCHQLPLNQAPLERALTPLLCYFNYFNYNFVHLTCECFQFFQQLQLLLQKLQAVVCAQIDVCAISNHAQTCPALQPHSCR